MRSQVSEAPNLSWRFVDRQLALLGCAVWRAVSVREGLALGPTSGQGARSIAAGLLQPVYCKPFLSTDLDRSNITVLPNREAQDIPTWLGSQLSITLAV